MNPADYIALMVQAREAATGTAMSFITLVFAYLVMTYFVGAKLTLVQVWLVSIVYSIFAVLPVYGAVQDFMMLNALAVEFYSNHPVEAEKFAAKVPALWPVFVVVAIIGWALSILFMLQTRRKGGLDAAV